MFEEQAFIFLNAVVSPPTFILTNLWVQMGLHKLVISQTFIQTKLILENSNKNQTWILLKWQLLGIWISVHKYSLKVFGHAPLNIEYLFLGGVECKR